MGEGSEVVACYATSGKIGLPSAGCMLEAMAGSYIQLAAAVRRNDIPGVERELARGTSINIAPPRVPDAATALGVAAASSPCGVEMLAFLLDAGASLNEGDSPALFHAAKAAHLGKVRFLLDREANPEFTARHDYTALHSATLTWGADAGAIVRLLWERGAALNAISSYGESPLGNALSMGNVETARWILAHGRIPKKITWPSLFSAILNGDGRGIRAHISDIRLRAFTRGEWSAPALAAMGNDPGVLDLLAELGVDFTQTLKSGLSPLHYAASANAVDSIRWLAQHGLDPNVRGSFGVSPIFEAVQNGSVEATRALLELGAESDALNSISETALHQAWNPAVAALLLDAGADIDRVGGQGYSLLMTAAEEGNEPLVKFLLERGASVAATSTGATALHYAMLSDEDSVIDLLLDAGADVNATDVDGQTPLFYARSLQASRLLIRRGANLHAVAEGVSLRSSLLHRDPSFASLFI
ncbi:ankyrin repeat domain-containing protein [bacterium]|nr:MAG: ankyrin repeat domain-containing protein [bacterium]